METIAATPATMAPDAAAPESKGSGADLKSIAWWKEAHRLQLDLCNVLESIADSLPGNIDTVKCTYAAKCLGMVIRDIHRFEENTLFPALSGVLGNAPDLTATIDRLKYEHLADESYADDLSEKLLHLGAGYKDLNMEALGYMLRGFFDALRRHIAFEQEYFSGVLAAPSVQ